VSLRHYDELTPSSEKALAIESPQIVLIKHSSIFPNDCLDILSENFPGPCQHAVFCRNWTMGTTQGLNTPWACKAWRSLWWVGDIDCCAPLARMIKRKLYHILALGIGTGGRRLETQAEKLGERAKTVVGPIDAPRLSHRDLSSL
jgi:hypothetical protein